MRSTQSPKRTGLRTHSQVIASRSWKLEVGEAVLGLEVGKQRGDAGEQALALPLQVGLAQAGVLREDLQQAIEDCGVLVQGRLEQGRDLPAGLAP